MQKESIATIAEDELGVLAQNIRSLLSPPMVVYLQGPLGAGKTSLMRAILRQLGHKENVASPTFSLVETYQCGKVEIHHFDLYRLESVEELPHLDIRDRLNENAIVVFEWPEKAMDSQNRSHLPPPDLIIDVQYWVEGMDKRVFSWRQPKAEERDGAHSNP